MNIIVLLLEMIITSQNVALEGSLLCNSAVAESCVDWEQTTRSCALMFANVITYDVIVQLTILKIDCVSLSVVNLCF
jgi:hypothetical protein